MADRYVSGVKADDWELAFGKPATGHRGHRADPQLVASND
jgi:hypothetical protein